MYEDMVNQLSVKQPHINYSEGVIYYYEPTAEVVRRKFMTNVNDKKSATNAIYTDLLIKSVKIVSFLV